MEAPRVCARAHCTRTSQANTCTHARAPATSSHVGTKLPPGELRGRCPVSTVIGQDGCRGDGPSPPSSLLVPCGFTCHPPQAGACAPNLHPGKGTGVWGCREHQPLAWPLQGTCCGHGHCRARAGRVGGPVGEMPQLGLYRKSHF